MAIQISPKKVEIIRPKKVYAEINPKMLIWARQTRGWGIEEAARKCKISLNTLKDAEKGTKKITIPQLINLSYSYKRPISIFYRDEPPIEQTIPDRRQIKLTKAIDGDLYVRIREIISLREFALEINDNPSYDYQFIGQFPSSAPNSEIINSIRSKIPLNWSDFGRKKDNDVLTRWIDEIEKLGIMVFQFKDIDPSVTRGFAISDTPYPIIGLNRKDTYYARIFSLLHEFVHLVIADISICTANESANQKGVERKCDAIAAEVLLPFSDLLNEVEGLKQEQYKELNVYLPKLSEKFKVSYSTILVCLFNTGEIEYAQFNSMMNNLPSPKKYENEGGPHPMVIWKSRVSNLYLSIIFNALRRNYVSRPEVMLNLGLTTKSFSYLEGIVGK